jgi:ribosomal protein L30E
MLPNITYNQKQLKALEMFDTFVSDSTITSGESGEIKYRIFGLFGYAGAGKTFIASEMIRSAIDAKKIDQVIVCTPTHKALDVIESYIKAHFFSHGRDEIYIREKMLFMTIHKLLEFRPIIMTETGSVTFKSKGDSKYFKKLNRKLIVVDECSMVSQNMIREITKYSGLYNVKILYLGDPMQLPPIKEIKSQVFDYGPEIIVTICLDQIMRTSSPTIMDACNAVREWDSSDRNLKAIVDKWIEISKKSNEKVFKLFHQKPAVVETRWFKTFVSRVKSGKLPIVLTWRNATAEKYNNLVRTIIHPGEDLDNYLPEDYVMFNNFYQSPDETVFFTSTSVKVISLITKSQKLYAWSNALIVEPTSKQEIDFNRVIKKCNKIKEIKVDYLKVFKHPDVNSIVRTINRVDLEEYQSAIDNIRDLIETFYSRHKHEILTTKLWKIYHDKIIGNYADICFGYSLTIHKAQGSTFEITFVDFVDIFANPKTKECHHALYTAVGRAAKELYLMV